MMRGEVLHSALLPRRERLWPLVAVSLAAHVGAIGFALLHRPPPAIDLDQKPIVAKLVRLGEKRPEQFLPRKEAEPPPPAPAPEAAPAPAPPKPAAPAVPVPAHAMPPPPKPKAAPRTSPGKGDVLASVLSRVRREQALQEPAPGDPEGHALGDSSESSAGDEYAALVQKAVQETYDVPATISSADRVRLRATVVIYLDADGQVLRYEFENRSGNAAFDAALERAIRAARIPPPPPELRRKYRSEGVGINYHM
jgi:colicin import membrane protein/protein TonB